MALTKISDIVEPAVYLKYQKEYFPQQLDIMSSTAISPLPAEVMTQLSAGGSTIDMPFWQDTDRSEPNAMTDDDTVSAPALKFTASRETARKIYWHKAWQQADLAGAFATGNTNDPLKQVFDYTENYWRGVSQITCIKYLDGILARDISTHSGDMRFSVYTDTASITAAMRISPASVNAARATMGEFMNDLGTIVMHSKVYTDCLNQENITFAQPSNLPFKIPKYSGMDVVVSDDCTVVAGTNSPLYRSYLLGPGALAFGLHFPETPVEYFRNPEKANGGGVNTLHNRRHAIIHPKGWRYTGTPAGKSPVWSEIVTSTNWARTMLRKNIKIAYLETN